ncbi:hypothetical protein DAT36_19790 [Photobacterium phosphoreum]|nr:hypothetical protein DAT36_19790 [Photobacterium phosphoreum]
MCIRDSNYNALDNFGATLLFVYDFEKDPKILEEAKQILLKAKLESGKANYNLACLYAIENDKYNCEKELLDCLNINVLPDKDHLDSDKDLDSIREDEWFMNFFNIISLRDV